MIQRLINLWKGFVNLFLTSVEQNNPGMVYDNAIESVLNTYQKLKSKAGAVIRRETELGEEKALTEKQLKQVTASLEAAANLPEDQVDLVAAAEAIRLQEQLTEKLSGLTEDYKLAQEDSKEIRDSLIAVESELRSMRAEKGTQVARYESAKARMEIMDMQDGTSISAARKSLEGVRNNIKDTIATAKLSKDMQNSTLESKVRQFQQVTAGQSAKDKFLELRKAAQAKNGNVKALDEIIQNTTTSAKTGV